MNLPMPRSHRHLPHAGASTRLSCRPRMRLDFFSGLHPWFVPAPRPLSTPITGFILFLTFQGISNQAIAMFVDVSAFEVVIGGRMKAQLRYLRAETVVNHPQRGRVCLELATTTIKPPTPKWVEQTWAHIYEGSYDNVAPAG